MANLHVNAISILESLCILNDGNGPSYTYGSADAKLSFSCTVVCAFGSTVGKAGTKKDSRKMAATLMLRQLVANAAEHPVDRVEVAKPRVCESVGITGYTSQDYLKKVTDGLNTMVRLKEKGGVCNGESGVCKCIICTVALDYARMVNSFLVGDGMTRTIDFRLAQGVLDLGIGVLSPNKDRFKHLLLDSFLLSASNLSSGIVEPGKPMLSGSDKSSGGVQRAPSTQDLSFDEDL